MRRGRSRSGGGGVVRWCSEQDVIRLHRACVRVYLIGFCRALQYGSVDRRIAMRVSRPAYRVAEVRRHAGSKRSFIHADARWLGSSPHHERKCSIRRVRIRSLKAATA